MDEYRSLTIEEIAALQRQGCTADDWSNIAVADDFVPDGIHHTAFYGEVRLGVFDQRMELEKGFLVATGIRHATLRDVSVGDNCLIENVGGYISRYDIADECYICDVGKMSCTPDATYGEGNMIAVLSEGGEGNVMLSALLTPQLAALMTGHADDPLLTARLRDAIQRDITRRRCERGQVGYRAKITHTTEITNAMIGEEVEIVGASRIVECTIGSAPDASAYVGHAVIIDNSVIQAGASVMDGAKVSNSLVGEACHVGKGASLESTLLFANSHIDNGETCAAFCGPFTVSHHKSTLLIGGMYSFYNAGSATNFSNHAYKMGPIHWGTLQRGSKTASGAHVLWPATIGPFSMCMGKIQSHPVADELPFSYLFGEGDATYVIPGRNLCTVGTYRDIGKWPRRDMRPRSARRGIINFDWLSPLVVRGCIQGKRLLESLRQSAGDDVASYHYQGCTIRNRSLVRGIKYYDMVIRLFLSRALSRPEITLPRSTSGTSEWRDLAGMLLPLEEETQLADDIRQGVLADIEAIERRLALIHAHYEEYRWNFAYRVTLDRCGLETITALDAERIRATCQQAEREWLDGIRYDAEREFQMGDVSPQTLQDFLDHLP